MDKFTVPRVDHSEKVKEDRLKWVDSLYPLDPRHSHIKRVDLRAEVCVVNGNGNRDWVKVENLYD